MKADSRPHLPPKPKVRSQPSQDSSRTTTVAEAAASSSSKETRTGEAPTASPLCAPATVRVKGSIGRQLAQRARSMGLQSAVKTKAKPPKAKQRAEDRTLHTSAPATETGGKAVVEAESGPDSSTGNNPAPSRNEISPTAAPEDTLADLPAPVLICPREDGTLVELGPLYRGTPPASDAAALAMEAPQQTMNTWMVDMHGERRVFLHARLDTGGTGAPAYTSSTHLLCTHPRATRSGRGLPRRADPDSSTSIEVTRVKQPRSRSGPSPTPSPTAEPAPFLAPVHEMMTPADDTGNAESRPSDTSGRTKGKKKKKKEKKRRQRSRSPSRKRRRRRRTSTPTEDAADDPPAEAVELPIRHVSFASPGPKPADPRLIAVQAADYAQEPTSPADGERDRSSVSELEYMFCCWGSARLFPPLQQYLSWCLITWVRLRDVLVSSLDRSPVSTAYRTAAFGSSGGWPPQTVAQHASGTTAELAFLPDCSVESDPCHTSSPNPNPACARQ